MSKTRLNQGITYLSPDEKKGELKNQKVQRHSFIIHKRWMMFMKIYKTIN